MGRIRGYSAHVNEVATDATDATDEVLGAAAAGL